MGGRSRECVRDRKMPREKSRQTMHMFVMETKISQSYTYRGDCVCLQLSERPSYLASSARDCVCARVRWRENKGERQSFRWAYRVRVRYACVCVTQVDGEFERGGKSSETIEWCVRELRATSQGICVRTMSAPKISSLDQLEYHTQCARETYRWCIYACELERPPPTHTHKEREIEREGEGSTRFVCWMRAIEFKISGEREREQESGRGGGRVLCIKD